MAGLFMPGDFRDHDDDPDDETVPLGRRKKANVRAIDREMQDAARTVAQKQGLGAAPVTTRQATPAEIERIFGRAS